MMSKNEISVLELQKMIEKKAHFKLIDVREGWERDIAKLEDDIHIPLSNWQPEKLPNNIELVFYCHHGVRSRYVVDQLLANNISSIYNLTGGINQWSLEIDNTVSVY